MVNKVSDPDTGLWSLNLTFRITAAQVSPQKFLYLGAQVGQNIVYRVTNVPSNFTVPLKVRILHAMGFTRCVLDICTCAACMKIAANEMAYIVCALMHHV